MTLTILVRGSGDIGSAVALALFRAGYFVFIHDSAKPAVTRRKMALCDAFFDGHAVLDGVYARLFEDISELASRLQSHDLIPATAEGFAAVLSRFRPEVLIDARMRKHEHPEVQIMLAPFTVGLGPNFTAGETVHAAVETGWNDALGHVIMQGSTRPLEGEPQTIGGHARERYVYAPAAGVFRTSFKIGDRVSEGQEVARVDSIPCHARISGILRGLTHDGVPVAHKTKVIEVDPRGDEANIVGIGERPGRIAEGVLQAVREWEFGRKPA